MSGAPLKTQPVEPKGQAQGNSGASAVRPGRGLEFRICTSLSEVDPAQWDRLLDVDDMPLLSWGYLQGLELAGCVGEEAGWLPAHILVRDTEGDGDQAGELLAAAPAYVKTNSDGEWVYDFDWAEFAEQQGIAYYPKLVLAVPFNPVTGGRLLTRPELPAAERELLRAGLLRTGLAFAHKAGLSSAHILFPRGPRPGPMADESGALAPETAQMQAVGFLLRQQEQYHFLNDGYRSFDDFLARLRSHRRSSIKRERRELAAAGFTVRSHRGLGTTAGGFSEQELDRVFDMYVATSQRYTGGPPFLNRRFFHLCAERLGDRLELVLARDRTGELVGGAWNLRGDRRLYGRYWGRADLSGPDRDRARDPEAKQFADDSADDSAADSDSHSNNRDYPGGAGRSPLPFLHFEVCYYHAIERCIEAGLSAFEPGHGGDQKLVRGFTPTSTYSAHYLRDARLRRPIEAFLKYEAPLVQKDMQEKALRSGFRAPSGPTKPEASLPERLPETLKEK